MSLPIASASFAALALTIYVILDGFDLGVGVLLLFQPDEDARNHMIDAITPTWDGNETWIILAGVTLLAGFPIAYGILMPALYLPLVIMLLALALRGVSFEFRVQIPTYRRFWDRVFAMGSLVAALTQGLVLGSLLQGVTIAGTSFSGGPLDFVGPLPILCAAALVTGYMTLGAGWLYLKGNRVIDQFARKSLRRLTPLFLLFCVMGGAAAYLLVPAFANAVLLHWHVLIWLASAFAVIGVALFQNSQSKWEMLPFLLALQMFLVGIAALSIVVYPDVIPFRMSVWDAASSRFSQTFVLAGALLVTPVVIGYSAFAYWIFRGKTPERGWEG